MACLLRLQCFMWHSVAAAAHHGMHAVAKVAYAHDVAPSLCTWQQNRPEACASLCLSSGPTAARADQRGQTLLSLPAMAVTVTLGAATSLLWAHAIHGTPKVSLPTSRSGQCTGQRTCDRVLSPDSWGMTRASKESLWIALVFLFLARGC